MEKTSKIWTTSKEELEVIVKSANSFSDILRAFGLSTNGASNHHRLKQRLKFDNIDFSHIALGLNNGKGKKGHKICYSLESILVQDSTYTSRSSLKKRLVSNGLMEYKCSGCGVKDWLGKPLVLQLDHINGVFNDNRIENLRLVCPNCHSQFTTFAGKNKPRTKKAKQYETNENRLVRIELTRKFNPTKKELTELISKLSLVKVGIYFGVSDNAIRKRCKILGVDWKK